MVNYLKNILASGIVTAIMAITPGCGDTNTYNYNVGKDTKQESSDVRVDTQIKDGYSTADLKTEIIEDLFIVGDNLDLKDAHDTNVDSNVEDLLTTEISADLKDTYVTEVSDVEDTYTAEVNADVEDTYVAEVNNVEDVFEISADVEDTYIAEVNNVEDVFEISADVEDTYVAEVSADIEDVHIAEVNADIEDTENFDSEVEHILSCENLNEVPACLGKDYATLVSSGWEVNTAIELEYAGVTTNQNVDNPTMIVSGNPCTLPGYFAEESCLDWINIEKPKIATIKLINEENIEIRGGLTERIAALTKLANGDIQGTECVVNIENNTVNCNEQPEE